MCLLALLLLDHLNPRDMRRQRHCNTGNDFICLLCHSAHEETKSRLCLDCEFSVSCWAIIWI
jgi:hypothetical protein